MAHGPSPLRKDCLAVHRLLVYVAPLALLLTTTSQNAAQTLTGDTTPANAGAINAATYLQIGVDGVGEMEIKAGESVTNDFAFIGDNRDGSGTVIVTGQNATWTNSGNLLVGRLGNGKLFILDGGLVDSDIGYIGEDTGSEGEVTVSGEGSRWNLLRDVVIGQYGRGKLTIDDGGRVSGESAFVGASPGSSGEVLITGTDGTNASTLALLYNLNIGDQGEGKLTVTNGGQVDISGWLTVGGTDEGEIILSDGGTASAYIALIGEDSLGTATLSNFARLDVADQLTVGQFGTGVLRIESGATITSKQGYVGAQAGSSGTATVTGAGALWEMTHSNLTLGNHGIGVMTIEQGGRVVSGMPVYLGASNPAAKGTLNVLGTPVARGVIETGGFGGGTGTAEIVLDGGVVRASASSSNFFFNYGNLQVTLGADGGYLDTQTHDIGIAPVLTGAGALVKQGTGTLTLTGTNTYAGGTTIEAGTLRLGNGGTTGSILGNVANDGILAFDRSDLVTFTGAITGNGGVHQTGSGHTILTQNNAALLGASRVTNGILSVNNTLGGTMDVVGGRLQGIGQVGATTNHAGGTIAPGNSIGTLTIAGDYVGAGGTLEIETVLGDDSTATDRLIVNGSTSGNTILRVLNVGGTGAQTNEGIRIVEIGGLSDGTFSLLGDYVFEGDQAVVGGAYAYRLYKGGATTPLDGHWYLRSSLIDAGPPAGAVYQAGAPLYEAYPSALQALNGLETLQQRVGNRAWSNNPLGSSERSASEPDEGIFWSRVMGSAARIDPQSSTTGTLAQMGTWQIQAGAEGQLHSGDSGNLVAALYARYGNVTADITSIFGNGIIDSTGLGAGGTLTWYGDDGVYVDGHASVTRYDGMLTSSTAGQSLTSGNIGLGYALGVEAGRKMALDEHWAITPQAQLVYSGVHFDSFTDAFGATVRLRNGGDLKVRLGISADFELDWVDDRGQSSRLHAYALADLHHDLMPDSSVDLDGVSLVSRHAPLSAGLGLGVTYTWGNSKFALNGQGRINAGLDGFGGNYALSGTVGLTAKF